MRRSVIAGVAMVTALVSAGRVPAQDAEVFGPGTISIDAEDAAFMGAFSPDGREFYFFRKVIPGREAYRIFVSRRTGTGWGVADTVRLGASPSDLYPAIDPTGRYLFFSSYRAVPGDTSVHPSAGIWMAERRGTGWSEPQPVAAATLPGHYHSGLRFDAEGRLRFFRLTHDYRRIGEFEGDVRDGTVSHVRPRRADGFQDLAAPMRLVGAVECPEADCVLLQTSVVDPASGRGRPDDLYVSFREGEEWSRPRALAAGVNSAGYEVFPVFTRDGRDLIFVRDFRSFYRVSWLAATGRTRPSQRGTLTR